MGLFCSEIAGKWCDWRRKQASGNTIHRKVRGTTVNSCSHINYQESFELLFLRKWRSVSVFGIRNKFGWIYILQGKPQLLGRKQTKKQNATKIIKEPKQENTTEKRPAMGIRRPDLIFKQSGTICWWTV